MSYTPAKRINSNLEKPLNELMRETLQKLITDAREHPEQIPIIVPKNN